MYSCMSTTSEIYRVVEIRPWYVSDLWYAEIDKSQIDLRNAVFIGGLPRPIKAGKVLIVNLLI